VYISPSTKNSAKNIFLIICFREFLAKEKTAPEVFPTKLTLLFIAQQRGGVAEFHLHCAMLSNIIFYPIETREQKKTIDESTKAFLALHVEISLTCIQSKGDIMLNFQQ
jgi:hypothetical protein